MSQKHLHWESNAWTLTWPTEPGSYLFYGDYKGKDFKPRMQFCHVWDNKGRTIVADGNFLFTDQAGAFKRLEVPEPPDLEALGLTQKDTAKS